MGGLRSVLARNRPGRLPQFTARVLIEVDGSITRFKAASVSNDGLKFPGRWPSAIEIGVHPYLFLRFQISIFAPAPARSSTTFGRFL